MSIILGFGDNDLKMITKTTVSPYVTDLTVLSTIYVYCDIVEPQVVGDTSAQLENGLNETIVRDKEGR